MISVDTGPAHVAAAIGCPLVVLFGSRHPSFYAPRGEVSSVEVVAGSTSAERPMLDITPADVTIAWERRTCAGQRAVAISAQRERALATPDDIYRFRVRVEEDLSFAALELTHHVRDFL
jgi:Glycosyltransferase family 9 (heptosyltransferase)